MKSIGTMCASATNGRDITKSIKVPNGDTVKVSYSPKDHRVSACVVDINGGTKSVKSEDMPKQLRETHDPMTFSAF